MGGQVSCVMGSKNLKAIVVRGSKSIRIADADKLFDIEHNALESIKARRTYSTFRKYGTTTLVVSKSMSGSMPVRNYQYSSESPSYGMRDWQRLSHDYIIDHYPHKWTSCFGCPLRCGAWVDLDERFGKHAVKSGRPEGATLSCGPLMEISSYSAMVVWNELCDQYGLGTFETAAAISAAMEWYEKGIISKDDTDDLEVKFGDANVMIELTHRIARREGFGNILAEGAIKAREILGAPLETTPHVKGKSMPTSLAGFPNLQLGYAVSPRGMDHLSGVDASVVYLDSSVSRWAGLNSKFEIPSEATKYHPNRAVSSIIYEDEMKLANLLGVCVFNGVFWVNQDRDEGDIPYYANILSAITGVCFDVVGLIVIAERFANLQKAYNVRLGLGRKDDQVHIRFKEMQSGPLKGIKFDQEGFDNMLDRYYELHGWDPETGVPRRDTLEGFGLKYVADDLEKRGIELGRGGHRYNIDEISFDVRGIKG